MTVKVRAGATDTLHKSPADILNACRHERRWAWTPGATGHGRLES